MPTHPADAARALGERQNLVSPLESTVYLAHETGKNGDQAVGQFLTRMSLPQAADVEPGLRLIAAVERLDGGDGAYDAVLGPDFAWTSRYSPSSLETLGGCPLRFFFQKILRIRPLDDLLDPHQLDPMDVGTRIHRILELVYQGFEGTDLSASSLKDNLATAEAILEPAWNEVMEPVRNRMNTRFPALWEATERIWRKELREFVSVDLKRLTEDGWVVDSVEPPGAADLTLSLGDEEITFHVGGRLDRLSRGADQEREPRYLVTDYKTGGNLDDWVTSDKLLLGLKLQLPLYTRIIQQQFPGADVRAELLGLGPSFFPGSGLVRKGPVVMKKMTDAVEEGMWETVGILVKQSRSGSYPPTTEKAPCDYCDFRVACRRQHYPSVERVKSLDVNRAFVLSREKKSKVTTVAEVASS